MQEPPLFSWRKEMGKQKVRHSCMPLNPLGVSVWFLALQSVAAFRPRVWVWLHNAASTSRPQFKTKGWGAPLSLIRFSQFSAQLRCEMYESTLCASSKAWCVVESSSQMALYQAETAAAPDFHRWTMQKRKWQQCLNPLLQSLECWMRRPCVRVFWSYYEWIHIFIYSISAQFINWKSQWNMIFHFSMIDTLFP